MHFEPKALTLFMILGSNSPENEADLESQRRTWLKDLSSTQSYLVLRGLPEAPPSLVVDELFLPVVESYENILSKTILGMKWALQNSNFEILIRTNVSTYFPPHKIEKVSRSINKSKLFLGGYVDLCQMPGENNKAGVEYVAGTGIILTRPTVQMLCDIDWSIYSKLPDDLAISIALRDAGIFPTRFRRNNLSQLHIFIPALQIRLKTSSVSKLASLRMENIYRFYHASSVITKLRMYLVIAINEFRFVLANWEEFSGFAMQAGAQSKRLFLRIVKQGK